MTTLTKSTRTRLIKDIKEILNYSKENNNIFYKHSEDNLLLGHALIIGDEDSPYKYGNYMFEIKYPSDYPFSPPKVKFLTNDGIIRYHPNLYKNGTCCLSILNTWKGDQWTACQTILSVLLSISSLFQNNSLILEPGIRIYHPDVEKYNRIIEYKNIDFAIYEIVTMALNVNEPSLNNNNELQLSSLSKCILLFKKEIYESFKNNIESINLWINNNKHINKQKISTSMYHLNVLLQYKDLDIKMKILESKYK